MADDCSLHYWRERKHEVDFVVQPVVHWVGAGDA